MLIFLGRAASLNGTEIFGKEIGDRAYTTLRNTYCLLVVLHEMKSVVHVLESATQAQEICYELPKHITLSS